MAEVVTAISMSVILMAGPEWVWRLFGPPDLGPVTFETLRRRTTPNDALACPPHFCKATSDLVPPLFAVDVNGLRRNGQSDCIRAKDCSFILTARR
jgi:hypothetical protein